MSNDNPLGVPAHRHRNPDGTEGGWVADTATVAAKAHIGRYARVHGGTIWGGTIYGGTIAAPSGAAPSEAAPSCRLVTSSLSARSAPRTSG